MIEDIKRAAATFIEARVTALDDRVSSTFPESTRAIPWCVVDVVASKSNPLFEGGIQTGLMRITVVDSKTRTLDQLFDDVYEAFIKYGYTITAFNYSGIESTSPLMPAMIEKDEIYKREMDVGIAWIVKR